MKLFGVVAGRISKPIHRNWPVLGTVTLMDGYWVYCSSLPKGFSWKSYRNPRTFLGCFLSELEGVDFLASQKDLEHVIHLNLLAQDCAQMFPQIMPGLYFAIRREFKLQKSLLKDPRLQDSES